MTAPAGIVDSNPPAGGYGDASVILLNPPAPFPRYTLRCPSDYGDPQWIYEGWD